MPLRSNVAPLACLCQFPAAARRGAHRTGGRGQQAYQNQLIFPVPVIHFVIHPRSDLTCLTDRNTAAPRLVILGREPVFYLFLVSIYLPMLFILMRQCCRLPLVSPSFFMPLRSINVTALKRKISFLKTWVLLFSFSKCGLFASRSTTYHDFHDCCLFC